MQFELNAKNLEKNGFRHIPASRERVGKPMVYYKKDGSNVFVVIFDSVYTVWSVPVKHLEKLKSYKQLHFAVKFIQSFDIRSKIDVVNNQISLVIPPVITTDTKSEIANGESVGVVNSVGDALFSLSHADLRTIQKALLCYFHANSNYPHVKKQSLDNITRLRSLFVNAQDYTTIEHQNWIKSLNTAVFAESGFFSRAE